MFETIARLSIRFRWLVVALWIAAPMLATLTLPSLSSVTQTNNSQFLSPSAPSQRAVALAGPFQGKNAGPTAIIVASRSSGPLTAADDAAIGRVERTVAGVPGVTFVRDQGASADGQARRTLVVTSPPPGLGDAGNPSVVNQIRDTFAAMQASAGLRFHLTGPLAQTTDAGTASTHSGDNIRKFTLLFVIVLLFIVFRSVPAPLVTLAPAVASLVLAGPLIAQAAKGGMPVSPATQELLIVLLLGAGADYGLFLVFRTREEIRRGAAPRDAVVTAMGRVGESITFSAATVIAALLCLLLTSFGLYRGLGPSLAIGLAVVLSAALTLLPALLALLGRAVFWPSHPVAGPQIEGMWGHIAERIIRRPIPTLAAGVVVFGALAAGLTGFSASGFTNDTPISGSDSAAGNAVIAAHFPAAGNNPESLLLRFATPVWVHPAGLALAQHQLSSAADLRAVTGPLNPNGTALGAAKLANLYSRLGPAAALPPAPPAGGAVPARLYAAYQSTAQFISTDGRTVQFYALPAAGSPGSHAAIGAIPALRATLATVARTVGAQDSGIAGQDAVSYDIDHASTADLQRIVPIVLAVIAILLAVLLRSLVAPLYLIGTVGLSYLAALGFAMIVFVHLGHDSGIIFIIPILLFIFAMALGEDYNILLMSRIREEGRRHTSPRDAITRAVGLTGGTITSAGLILAGTFTVLGLAGNSGQARQLGFTVAFAVFLDTFFVRTLLVPSIAVLLGRWNWWPSQLSSPPANQLAAPRQDLAGDRV